MCLQRRFRTITTMTIISMFMVSALLPAGAQDPPRPPTPKPPVQQKSDQPKKIDRREGAQVEEQSKELDGTSLRISTELVQLDVKVIDQNNTPVFDLNRDDFIIFEDKVRQSIESVSREEVPLSIGLVIDTSGSMRSRLQTVTDAALGLIKQMRSDDEGFVAQFKAEAELVQEFTNDKRELEDAIGELFTSGGTALLDAIIATADYAQQKGKQRRKALIIISDGLEKNSSVKEREVVDAIKEDEVQVYLIGFIDEEGESRGLFGKSSAKRAKELLAHIAEDSGGRAFFPREITEMPAIAAQIAKDLRMQYVISYYPTNEVRDGKFRTVQVSINPRNSRKMIARTRQGYYARVEKGAARPMSEKRIQ